MVKKRESRRQLRIRKRLEKEFPGSFWFKVHGGPFQRAGIPDLNGCVEGLYITFEVKEPDGELSELQSFTLKLIRDAGGIAEEVVEPADAVAHVRRALAKRNR